MLIALLSDGHILVEGAPGLAKTRAINVLSGGWKLIFTGSSSRLTCCRLTLPELKSIDRRMVRSSSSGAAIS